MDTIDCPKCGCEHEPAGNHEDDAGEMTCEQCGFVFVVDIDYEPSYNTRCKEHSFNEWSRWDDDYDSRQCQYCLKSEVKLVK